MSRRRVTAEEGQAVLDSSEMVDRGWFANITDELLSRAKRPGKRRREELVVPQFQGRPVVDLRKADVGEVSESPWRSLWRRS